LADELDRGLDAGMAAKAPEANADVHCIFSKTGARIHAGKQITSSPADGIRISSAIHYFMGR
jgi:hypothetical protein